MNLNFLNLLNQFSQCFAVGVTNGQAASQLTCFFLFARFKQNFQQMKTNFFVLAQIECFFKVASALSSLPKR